MNREHEVDAWMDGFKMTACTSSTHQTFKTFMSSYFYSLTNLYLQSMSESTQPTGPICTSWYSSEREQTLGISAHLTNCSTTQTTTFHSHAEQSSHLHVCLIHFQSAHAFAILRGTFMWLISPFHPQFRIFQNHIEELFDFPQHLPCSSPRLYDMTSFCSNPIKPIIDTLDKIRFKENIWDTETLVWRLRFFSLRSKQLILSGNLFLKCWFDVCWRWLRCWKIIEG